MSDSEYPTDMKMSFEIKDGKVFYEWRIGSTCQVGSDAICVDYFLTLASLIRVLDSMNKSKHERWEREMLVKGVKRDAEKTSEVKP